MEIMDTSSSYCTSLDYADRPFIEFLKYKKLTSNLIQFIVHAIAMVNDDTPTVEVPM